MNKKIYPGIQRRRRDTTCWHCASRALNWAKKRAPISARLHDERKGNIMGGKKNVRVLLKGDHSRKKGAAGPLQRQMKTCSFGNPVTTEKKVSQASGIIEDHYAL